MDVIEREDGDRDAAPPQACPECGGDGFHPDAPDRTCRMCFGTGRVRAAIVRGEATGTQP